MVGLSAPVLGFFGGVFGGVLAQSLAYIRRRKRHIDRLTAVLRETKSVTKHQLENADTGHGEMTDEDLNRLWRELKEARLQASYLLNEGQREKIDKLDRQFGYISHSAGDSSTSIVNDELAEKFTEYSNEALSALPRI